MASFHEFRIIVNIVCYSRVNSHTVKNITLNLGEWETYKNDSARINSKQNRTTYAVLMSSVENDG
jgi:hypothetical protein